MEKGIVLKYKQEFIASKRLFRGFLIFDDLVDFLKEDHTYLHPLLTTSYLCGQYAYYAATARDSINNRSFKTELKLLSDLGIIFNFNEALEVSEKFTGMLNNEQAIIIWY